MSRTIKSEVYYDARLAKLVNNGKDNSRIVKKLERQKRTAAAFSSQEGK